MVFLIDIGAPENSVEPHEIGAATNRNLLDNWYFLDPINQRGATEYTVNGYTIDRWITYNDPIVTLSDDGITIAYTGTTTRRNVFTQYIEVPEEYRGKTVTVSSLIKNVSGTVYFTVGDGSGVVTGTGVTDVGVSQCTFTVSESATTLYVYFLVEAACTFTAVAAKMELGSGQTLARQDADGAWVLNDPPPNKARELAKCQRFQMLYTIINTGLYGIAYAVSATIARITLEMPVAYRSGGNPSIIADTSSIELFDGANHYAITRSCPHGHRPESPGRAETWSS